MNNKRIFWVDAGKVFSIFLIVLGHAMSYNDSLRFFNTYMYCFRIPFFFFFLAMTFSINKYGNFKEFVINKFKTIMIPYFIFALLSYVIFIILGRFVVESLDTDNIGPIYKQLIGIFYGNGHDNYLIQNTPLWFLPCLFSAQVMFYFVEKLKHKNKYLIILVAAMFLGYLDKKFMPVRLPWGIDIALSMTMFFSFGKMVAAYIKEESKMKDAVKINLLAIILILIGLMVSTFNDRVNTMNNYYGNYILFIISSFSSIIGYTLLIKQLPNNKIVSYIGKSTMAILVMHKFPILVFQTIFASTANILVNGGAALALFVSIIVSIISIVMCIMAQRVINKINPKILGNYSAPS